MWDLLLEKDQGLGSFLSCLEKGEQSAAGMQKAQTWCELNSVCFSLTKATLEAMSHCRGKRKGFPSPQSTIHPFTVLPSHHYTSAPIHPSLQHLVHVYRQLKMLL